MAQALSVPQAFQRTIAASPGRRFGRDAGSAPPNTYRITLSIRSLTLGSVVLGVDLEDVWRDGVRELGAGPLGVMLDAAFETVAMVSHAPLHPLSLEVQALEPYQRCAGPVTSEAQVVEALGPHCFLEGRICTAAGKILATGRARFGPPPIDGLGPLWGASIS